MASRRPESFSAPGRSPEGRTATVVAPAAAALAVIAEHEAV